MAERLAGRVGVVTGGASGIGLATARQFVDEGAPGRPRGSQRGVARRDRPASSGRGRRPRSSTSRSRPTSSGSSHARSDGFGGLDVAVNCAGLGTLSPVADHPLDEWRTVIGVCLTGMFLSLKHEAQAMRAGGRGGAIVNIASINAKVPAVGMAAYCSAKAGVEMLTRCAAWSSARRGSGWSGSVRATSRPRSPSSRSSSRRSATRTSSRSRWDAPACRDRHRGRRTLPRQRRGVVGLRRDALRRRRRVDHGLPRLHASSPRRVDAARSSC